MDKPTTPNLPGDSRSERRCAWQIALVAFVCSRLALLLVGWLALSFIATHADYHQHAIGPIQATKSLACHFDCTWYMDIARRGYSTSAWPPHSYATNLAFWPALPYMARYLHDISRMSILMSGMLLVNIACVLSLYFLYRYCRVLDFDRSTATFATLLLAFAPQGFLFSVFYADVLTLLGCLGAMYFARTRRWWLAGLFAILASSSRPTGIVVWAFLVVYAWQTLGWRNFWRPWIDARPFIPVVLAPAGHFLAMWMAFVASGDAFAEVHTRAQGLVWMVHFGAPWSSIVGDFRGSVALKFWSVAALLLSTSIIPLVKRRWAPEAVFAICYFVLIFSQHNPAGLLHYAIVLPTIYVGFAWMFRKFDQGKLVLLGIFASAGAAIFCAWALNLTIAI
jgi:hypothetical protein